MKKLSEKDLELNPNVVTNLTGNNANGAKNDTDVCQTAFASCNGSCVCSNGCLTTKQITCDCNETASHGEQCCALTVEDTCTNTNYVCPGTNTCDSCIMCYESEGCPPVLKTDDC